MELGLSLGNPEKPFNFLAQNNTSNHQQLQKTVSQKGSLDFCMALGLSSSTAGVREPEKTQKSQESDDEASIGDASDDNHEENTHLQLNLLPLAPAPHQITTHLQSLPWSSDNNGSSENGSSGNMGMPAARGLDVNRLPPAAAEEVSSPFGMYRSSGNKRDFDGTGNDVVEGDGAGSRASDDDETGINGRKKLRLSKEQSAFLEESFKEHNTLNPKQKLALAKQLNLRPRQVEVWFQNRRARTKLKQTEVDCEYLKRCCETLSEENRRLHKELQELRALKASNPSYMQPPATTLTMCPSCERVATSSAPGNRPVDSVKAIPFPLSKPRFYPFSHPSSHSNQSAAS